MAAVLAATAAAGWEAAGWEAAGSVGEAESYTEAVQPRRRADSAEKAEMEAEDSAEAVKEAGSVVEVKEAAAADSEAKDTSP